MKKLALVVTLAFGLVLGITQVTAAFDFVPGARLQIGGFTYSLSRDNTVIWSCSVPQPTIIWTADVERGNLVGSAFYGKYKLGPGAVPDPSFDYTEYSTSAIGDSEVCGVDVGYHFPFGSFTVTPTIGYRRSQFWAGFTDPEDGGYTGGAFGLEVSGYRAGVEASVPVADRLALRAGIGYGLRTRVRELDVYLYNHPEGGHYETVYCYWEELDQLTANTDFSVSLAYRLSSRIALEGGYSSSSGKVTLTDTDGTWDYSLGSSAYYLKARLAF